MSAVLGVTRCTLLKASKTRCFRTQDLEMLMADINEVCPPVAAFMGWPRSFGFSSLWSSALFP